jgi:hypothetical protein
LEKTDYSHDVWSDAMCVKKVLDNKSMLQLRILDQMDFEPDGKQSVKAKRTSERMPMEKTESELRVHRKKKPDAPQTRGVNFSQMDVQTPFDGVIK